MDDGVPGTKSLSNAPQAELPSPPMIAGRHRRSWAWFGVTTLLLLATDLVTKWLAFERVAGEPIRLTRENAGLEGTIPNHPAIPLIPGVMSLKLTTNTGAVFGLGKGGQWVFVTVSVVASLLVCRFFYTSRPGARSFHVALGLVLAGALGNMYDRVRFNAVRDLLRLFPETQLWPWIFNVADAALMVGVGLIIVNVWWADRGEACSPVSCKPAATTTD